MTNEPDARGMLNPFLLWTDMGMRATEMTLASLQNMTEGADRLTRAGASAEVEEPHEDDGLGGMGGMQRLMWDLMTQNWLRWASAFGSLLSASAGVGLARKVAGQDNPLQAVRDSFRPATWGEKPATGEDTGATEYPAERRARRSPSDDSLHALASDEARPRRKATAGTRRTRRSTRK
jgi:hypothetical protein